VLFRVSLWGDRAVKELAKPVESFGIRISIVDKGKLNLLHAVGYNVGPSREDADALVVAKAVEMDIHRVKTGRCGLRRSCTAGVGL